jgi:hypothetical protein
VPVRDTGFEMNAGFDHGFAPTLTGEAAFHRRQDLVVGDLEFVDIEAVEIGDIDRRQELTSSTGSSRPASSVVRQPAVNMSIHYFGRPESQLVARLRRRSKLYEVGGGCRIDDLHGR